MLSEWYDSYTKATPKAANPAMPTALPAQPAAQPGMLTTQAMPAASPAAPSAAQWTPGKDATVQGQLAGVLDAGGPLMDRATTRANQQMNARGLLNSSIAVGAGQSALYDAALPIASQDAQTFGRAGEFNASAANQAGLQREGFKQQTSLQDADFGQQTKTQAADLASRYNLANMDVQSRATLQAADAANQQKLQVANAALQTGLQASDAAVKQSMQAYDAALKQSMQGTDNAAKLGLATLDAENRVALAGIEAKYKKEMQSSQSMVSSYQGMVDSFTKVMMSDLDTAAKQKTIGNLTTLYNNTLKMQSDVSGLELGKLLAFEPTGGAPGAPPAPAQQPPINDLLDYGVNESGEPIRMGRG